MHINYVSFQCAILSVLHHCSNDHGEPDELLQNNWYIIFEQWPGEGGG